ncbi:MAG: class I SAM-dependent methyltransferase [Burkholderiales bacterium]
MLDRRRFLTASLAAPLLGAAPALRAQSTPPGVEALLDAAVSGAHRSSANRARDIYRNPKETLLFFGLKPEMTAVELWPDAGWFTEVIAPVLRERGRFIAAHYPLEHRSTTRGWRALREGFETKLKAHPGVYDRVVMAEMATPDQLVFAPPSSVDMVFSFRSLHVWAYQETDDIVLKAIHAALKPGGILGIEDHRAVEGTSKDRQVRSGYMTESYAIAACEKAGFRLAGRSEVNANPRDTKDYPEGVWALPPSLSAKDREKHLAIGESDRMTLRFVKA